MKQTRVGTKDNWSETAAPTSLHHMFRVPERLVGVGFRCWMRGLSGTDDAYFDHALAAFSPAVGQEQAKQLLLDLSHFARAVAVNSTREIAVQRLGCAGLCRDECLAVAVIAACQHGRRDALVSAARALVGCDAIGDTLCGAQAFSVCLSSANQWLAKESICPATCALRIGRNRLS